MIFPFSIKYSARLSNNFSIGRNKEALEFIEAFITKKTGVDIVIENDKLTFKSKFFKWGRLNTNILVPIEKGVFNIVDKGEKTILTYEFYMYHLFIAVTIMSVFMATVSQEVWFGIFCFLWSGGMSWLIAIIRHKMMLNEIANKIDNLVNNLK
ncbi:hypothetical protein [Chryseobacterium oncorhynchi]|uniref:Uncharacterized protein n=1 Tax=Chryseobacterium oncorhynchi TaxID=741074 RepID=A0A316WZ34_9FLAO|nr:hypothetical protein [Chryseobacterium oncorhynchi]PWN66567.1 hypothetical protein C1638_009470 [Chryseobacterium oncorhynchi]